MRIAQCDSWTRNRSPLDPINTRPTGRTDRCAGQYVLLVCLHIRVDQNIGRLCWLFGPHTGTFEQISRPDISVLSKNSAASLDAALCFRFETKAFCSIVCPGKQLVTDAHLRMGLTQHTVRSGCCNGRRGIASRIHENALIPSSVPDAVHLLSRPCRVGTDPFNLLKSDVNFPFSYTPSCGLEWHLPFEG